MSANLTMTDLFCGAGGSSTGAVAVPGVSVQLAANHWALAIETHNANHPDTDHLQADISQFDPRRVRSTDLLWASPECTNHSQAKGRKRDLGPDLFGDSLPDAAAERSRATMWDVPRFAEVHRYRAIVVENVVEAAHWIPFRQWLEVMAAYGYRHRIVSLNSMHAQWRGLPSPQSRDRLYVVFWRKGERAPDLERMLRPKAYCPTCDAVVDAMQSFKKLGQVVGRYRSQYVYRCPSVSCRNQAVEPAWLPAASVIDWSLPGTRIGDRARPLAEKTMRRIQMGIDKYWAPLVVEAAGHTYDAADPAHPAFGRPDGYMRAWPTSDPLRTLHTSGSKALAYPVMVPVEGRDGKSPAYAADPLRTLTARSETGVVFPPSLTQFRDRVRDRDPSREPLPTVVSDGANHGLVMSYNGRAGAPRPTDEPYPTFTAVEHQALLTRMNNIRGEDQSSLSTPVDEVMRTLTSACHQALLVRGESRDSGAKPSSEPMGALTAWGSQFLAQRGQSIDIDDVYFRMLEPSEAKRGMAFPAEYEMLGNRREQFRLAGNAVTPPSARDLISCISAAITGEEAA